MQERLMRAAAALVGVALLVAATAGCKKKPAGHVEMVAAPAAGDAAALIGKELARAQKDGKQLLVYVGATWCEPCRRFHQAAADGSLDGALPTLRLLEFDADRDNERLAFAGYFSQYIPLFALPKADGHASGKQIEGSVKGDGGVALLVGKLRTLMTP
jgi:thiol-disulfide isomerase/thioredoxin